MERGVLPKEIEDKIALRELVDQLALLTDRKDVASQIRLFTEGATIETFAAGYRIVSKTGLREIKEAFAEFLSPLETVFHLNGQHAVSTSGGQGTGRLYCTITIVRGHYCKRVKTSIGVVYDDTYRCVNAVWMIAQRKLTVTWQESQEVKRI